MLVIRYNRVGRRNFAQFRVVVQEHTAAPNNRHVAIVGSYNPHTKEAQLKTDEIKDWISKGAQPSDSVWNLLVKEGIVDGEKRKVKMSKKKKADGDDEEGAEKASEEKKDDAKEEKEEKADDSSDKDDAKEEPVKEEKKEDAPADDAKEEKKDSTKEEKSE